MNDEAARAALESLAAAKAVSADDIEAGGWDPDELLETGLALGILEVVGLRADGDGVMRTVYRRVL